MIFEKDCLKHNGAKFPVIYGLEVTVLPDDTLHNPFFMVFVKDCSKVLKGQLSSYRGVEAQGADSVGNEIFNINHKYFLFHEVVDSYISCCETEPSLKQDVEFLKYYMAMRHETEQTKALVNRHKKIVTTIKNTTSNKANLFEQITKRITIKHPSLVVDVTNKKLQITPNKSTVPIITVSFEEGIEMFVDYSTDCDGILFAVGYINSKFKKLEEINALFIKMDLLSRNLKWVESEIIKRTQHNMEKFKQGGISYNNYGMNTYGIEGVTFKANEITPLEVNDMVGFCLNPVVESDSVDIFALKGDEEALDGACKRIIYGHIVNEAVELHGNDFHNPEQSVKRQEYIDKRSKTFKPWYDKMYTKPLDGELLETLNRTYSEGLSETPTKL